MRRAFSAARTTPPRLRSSGVGWWLAEQAGTGPPGAKVPEGGSIIVAYDVFVSYVAEDKPAADAVCTALERRQIRCWIAPRDARPGLDYADSIIDALDETSVVVFIVSSRSIVSPHVKREVEHAANRGTHVIPFRIEDVELSRGLRYFLGTVHWIDALTPPIDKHLDYLIETVQYFLDKKHAAERFAQISPAAPEEPAPRSVVPPSVPPRYEAAPQAAVDLPPVAGLAATAPPPGPVPTSAPQDVPPAAVRAESQVLPAPPAATSAEPASSRSGRTASTSPPASPAGRSSLPNGDEASRVGPSGGIVATRGGPADAPSGPRPQGSAAATSGAGSAVEGPSASRPETKHALWKVVGFATVGAALGELLAFATFDSSLWRVYMLLTGFHTRTTMRIAVTIIMIVPAAIVTWAWLSAVRRRTLSPAVMGGLGGILGAWPSWAMHPSDAPGLPSYLVIAQALQWTAFGVAGGLAAVRGRSARPAVSMSIALVCVFFVRTLYLMLHPRGRLVAFEFLLLDLLTAIGWSIGLIVCPATTAAFRQPQAPSDAAAAGGATPNPRI